MTIALGIEGTAHTFGIGIIDDTGKVLANVADMFKPESGGIHPREAANHHVQTARKVLKHALSKADMTFDDIDIIAFSQGPGLGPCLRVTATIARALALFKNKPLFGVNHSIAHIEIGRLSSGEEDPLTVYVSGGNTIVSAFTGNRYRAFGETLDIAIGNLLDTFAREAGIPHPGGPVIEKLALKVNKYHPLPYSVKGMDVSYSGILTTCIRLLKEKKIPLEEICYSLQETAFGMIAEVSERALVHTNKNAIVLTGGVARNKRLQSMIKGVAETHDANYYTVPKELAGDNGAMIAWTGLLEYKYAAPLNIEDSFVLPKWRIEDVEIPWRTLQK